MKGFMVCSFLVLFSSYCQAAEIRRFPLVKYDMALTHRKGGESCYQAQRRSKSDFAFGGGYFEPRSKKLIDLVIVRGKTLKSYRWDWKRPILVIKKGKVSILRPRKRKRIKVDADFAIACDYRSTHRRAFVGRQIVAIKNNIIYTIKVYSSESYANQLLKKYGLTNYVYLDGGSSTPVGSRIPVHLLFTRKI